MGFYEEKGGEIDEVVPVVEEVRVCWGVNGDGGEGEGL